MLNPPADSSGPTTDAAAERRDTEQKRTPSAQAERQSRRVAVVTAASRGIGLGAARALTADHDLVMGGRSAAGLASAARQLSATPATVRTVLGDVSDPGGAVATVEAACREFGGVDVLVANAGGPRTGTFGDLDDDAWREGIDLVLLSVVRSVRAALPAMLQAGRGRVIVIGSSSAVAPIKNLMLSNVLRPALAGLVTALAQEVAGSGVTVNLIAPGRIDTDRVRTLDESRAAHAGVDYESFRAQAENSIPARRYGDPAEVGGLVAFLASDAAAYITGQTLLIDGGLIPRLP
jgi:3-oxoacyl-[acyl-carrier protein] reductase